MIEVYIYKPDMITLEEVLLLTEYILIIETKES
jgi:hypothetical protein